MAGKNHSFEQGDVEYRGGMWSPAKPPYDDEEPKDHSEEYDVP